MAIVGRLSNEQGDDEGNDRKVLQRAKMAINNER